MKIPKALQVVIAMVVFEGTTCLVNQWWQSLFSGVQVENLLFSSDSQIVYGVGGDVAGLGKVYGWVWAWDTSTGRLRWKTRASKPISQEVLSPDGKSLLTSDWQCKPTIWDTATGKLRYELQLDSQQDKQFPAYFTPDSQRIFGCFKEGIRIWNARTGARQEFWKLPIGTTGLPQKLQFSADGKKVLVEGISWGDGERNGEGFLQLWDSRNGRVLKDFGKDVAISALSPSGKTVVLVYNSQTDDSISWAKIYDVATSARKIQHPELTSLESLEFVSENSLLCKEVRGRWERNVHMPIFHWDIRTGRTKEQAEVSTEYDDYLSPNKKLKARTNQGGYRNCPPLGALYNATSGKKLYDLEGLAGR
ncbi:MAG: WD40 repeat domain-containing protein [Armatimonas sp.]